MGRVMGVDVGAVRIGVAMSDESGLIARPFQTVARTGRKAALDSLGRLASENEVDLIVVGLPLSMDGSEQESTEDARRIARSLGGRTGLQVLVWDERLTSVQAERALIDAGVRRKRRKEVVDQVAAAVMLQSYLDSRPADGPGAPGGNGT